MLRARGHHSGPHAGSRLLAHVTLAQAETLGALIRALPRETAWVEDPLE